jgi:hypothetical protein
VDRRYPPHFDPSMSDDDLRASATRLTGIPCADLATKFESFGNDCEFGHVQRKCGAEPRFSNPAHDVILRAVSLGYADVGTACDVELDRQVPRREWIVVDRPNRLREHTFIYEGDQEASVVRAKQLARVAFLRRNAIENLLNAAHIYVIKAGQGHLTQEITANIAAALRVPGPNMLLWVEPGDDVGRIDDLGNGLLRGTIDRLTVEPNAGSFSFAGWLAVLVGAWNYALKWAEDTEPKPHWALSS